MGDRRVWMAVLAVLLLAAPFQAFQSSMSSSKPRLLHVRPAPLFYTRSDCFRAPPVELATRKVMVVVIKIDPFVDTLGALPSMPAWRGSI